MERAIIRLSPENFITVAILSAAAYLGVVGAQKAGAYFMAKGASAKSGS